MLDEISQAVLSREEIARYLEGSHGQSGRARERIEAYLEEMRTTQRYSIYRALKHPLYPILRKVERIVDAACMHLVMNPTQFDVLLLPNLYGDIVSDLCAGLVGGLGVVPAANLGVDTGVFEAVHGSAPDIAGKSVANPMALLLSALLMLRHIDEGPMADRIMKALGDVLSQGKVRTRDLGGKASTIEFTDAICRRLEGRPVV